MSEQPTELICCLYCWRLSRAWAWTENDDRCPSCRASAASQHFRRVQAAVKGGSTRRVEPGRYYRILRSAEGNDPS